MARRLLGMAAVWGVALSAGTAQAGEPHLKTSRSGDQATITLRAGGLTVTQTLTPSAALLRVEVDGDAVQFAGDLDGRVTLERGRTRRTFMVRTASSEDKASVQAMLADSPALRAFDRLLQSAWARTAESATPFKTTRAALRALEGDNQVGNQLVNAVSSTGPTTASLGRVRQRLSPSQCWDTYAKDVVHFTYELQSCLGSVGAQWWNPFATAWCAYEYNLKSSLASVWLLDCYGVPV